MTYLYAYFHCLFKIHKEIVYIYLYKECVLFGWTGLKRYPPSLLFVDKPVREKVTKVINIGA